MICKKHKFKSNDFLTLCPKCERDKIQKGLRKAKVII